MFDNVVQYVDFVVGRVECRHGKLGVEELAAVVSVGTRVFGEGQGVRRGRVVCGSSSVEFDGSGGGCDRVAVVDVVGQVDGAVDGVGGSGSGCPRCAGAGVSSNARVVDENVVGFGTQGDDAVQVDGVSARTLENRKRRQEKKIRKNSRKESGFDWRKREGSGVVRAFPLAVDKSWVERKNAENFLKAAQAKRQLQLLEARDLEGLKEMDRTRVLRDTERNRVAVEKAHMTLRNTGNVPGFVQTVVSDAASGSISPDSSASQHEFRAAQKRVLDLEAEVVELKRRVRVGQFDALADGRDVEFTLDSKSRLASSVVDELEKRFDGEYNRVSVEGHRCAAVYVDANSGFRGLSLGSFGVYGKREDTGVVVGDEKQDDVAEEISAEEMVARVCAMSSE